jgi:hypothetical protein
VSVALKSGDNTDERDSIKYRVGTF